LVDRRRANTVKPLRLWTARALRRQLEWRLAQSSALLFDKAGYPKHDGMYAGIGGTYRQRRGD